MTRLYPSAPLENFDKKQNLEKKLNDVSSFNNSVNNLKEMNTYFEDENDKWERNFKKNKMLPTVLKPLDTFVNFTRTSSSITLSLKGVGLKIILKSTGKACRLTIINKII